MLRCCQKQEGEFEASYASALVAPNLEERVLALEGGQLKTNLTSWCRLCKRNSLITSAGGLFKKRSALYAHVLVLSERDLI